MSRLQTHLQTTLCLCTFLSIAGPLQAVEQVDAIAVWGRHAQEPQGIPEGLINVQGLAVGFDHVLAIRNDNTVAAWGDNSDNQTNVPAGLENVIAVAASTRHSLALKSDGTVVQWGFVHPSETDVPPDLDQVVAVASASDFRIALKSDKTLVTWPPGPRLKLVTGYIYPNLPPTGLTNVTAIAAGGNHALALKSDGTVVTWGMATLSNPGILTPDDLDDVIHIAAGHDHSLALKSDGTVVAWGNNDFGQTDVPPDLTGVIALAGGNGHSLALKSDGSVEGWGSNSNEQISTPGSLNHVTVISAGNHLSAAITKKNAYLVHFNRGDHGTISGGLNPQTILEGESAGEPSISPDAHWSLLDWGGDTTNISRDQTFTAQYSFNIPLSAGVIFAEPIEASVELPSFVTVAFRLTDTSGRGLNVPNDIVTGDQFFEVFEDSQPLSPSESFLQVAKIDEASAEIKTVLMLDNSFSVAPNLAQIKAAAKGVVAKALPGQTFAVYSFSGSPILLQDFTANIADLESAIDSIGFGQPTTNLYGSAIEGLSRWNDSYTAGNVTRGFMILFTDGSDQSGINTLPQVLAARGDKQIYTIGLGNEIDSSSLNQIGNAGNYEIENASELDSVFDNVQTEIKNDTNSFYWLNYISPKRGDNDRALTVTAKSNPYGGSGRALQVNFNSNGFTDVAPQVVINRGVFTPEGITAVTFSTPTGTTLKADTILGFVASNYEWTLSNPAVARITTTSNGQAILEPLEEGSTTLTVTDLANDAIVPDFFLASIPITVSATGVPTVQFGDWATTSGLSGEDAHPDGDPNGDGLSNLLSYALGIHPLDGIAGSPGAAAPSAGTISPGGLMQGQVTFNIPNPSPSDITYIIEETCTLAPDDWTAIATSTSNGAWTGTSAVTPVDNANGFQTISANSSEVITATPTCFLRVRVVKTTD